MLLEIEVGIEKMLKWEDRFQYKELFQDFMNKKIDNDSFSIIFMRYHETYSERVKIRCEELERKIKNNESIESDFQKICEFCENNKYEKLGLLLIDLFNICYCLTLDKDLYETLPEFYLTEASFEEQAKAIITKLELYLN